MSDEKKLPYTIGFCGRSGSGKSYSAKKTAKALSCAWIDADAVYHELLMPSKDGVPSECSVAIEKELGVSVITNGGYLDRKKLSEIVFSDSDKLKKLNTVTHRFIRDEIIQRLLNDGRKVAVLDAVLLPFSCCKDLCSEMISVIADDDISVERILARDGISREAAISRLSSQPSEDEYRDVSDVVLHNGRDPSLFDVELDELISKLNVKVSNLGN